MMKKLLLVFFCLTTMQLVRAQSTYDFSAVNDDGLTLYYKVINETKKEVLQTTRFIPMQVLQRW